MNKFEEIYGSKFDENGKAIINKEKRERLKAQWLKQQRRDTWYRNNGYRQTRTGKWIK